ncbi:hypothetical protein KCU91_g7522, partial [Aureobasidium melanogenum]
MSSKPDSHIYVKTFGCGQLRSKVSEQSIEPLIWTKDEKKTLLLSETKKQWQPLTQKSYFLVSTILASGALIGILQVYLERSNRDTGILFAPRINDLPLSQTFCYLYLPTIVALVLSFVWTWIDLDIKRLEPFVQLSRLGGALGKDSVLLHYPFDFVAFVPFAAMRKRHWPVFSASLAVVLIFWGLTPLQSSIFATKMVDKVLEVPAVLSTTYLSLNDQKTTLTGLYAQSVYNIAWLNENLPPFMDRQVDINCEEVGRNMYNSWGCHYDNYYMNLDATLLEQDQYSTMYVGYWYEESMDSYLLGQCPKEANQTFLVRWLSGESIGPVDETNPQNVNTTLWCRPTYYQQEVRATVVPPEMHVLDIVPVGPKQPLPGDLINITDFEWSMSQGYEKNNNRGSYPTSSWPDPKERLQSNFPKFVWSDYLPNLATFALGAYQRPLADYLDAETLRNSYQAAYHLLLARKLADILSSDLSHTETVLATRQYQTQTVIMVSTFVYIVEGLLASTTIIALLIFIMPSWRKTNLVSEPSSIASLMTLTGNDQRIIKATSEKDCATTRELENLFQDATFHLQPANDSQESTLSYLGPDPQILPSDKANTKSLPLLPIELSWIFGVAFLMLQGSVMAAMAYTYIRAQLQDGLPLPSKSLFANQIVIKYLPMVLFATASCDDPSAEDQTHLLGLDLLHHDVPGERSFCSIQQFALPINGSGIPHSYTNTTYDHFYIAMSNLTAGTPLPAWTDETFFYVPFQGSEGRNASATLYRAITPAVSASLHCFPMYQRLSGKHLTWDIPAGSPSCDLSSLQTYETFESQIPEAIEYLTFMNTVTSDNHVPDCELTVLAGWCRSSMEFSHQPVNASWIGCQPQLHVELREVVVDTQGFVQSSKPINDTMSHDNQLLQDGSKDIFDAFHALLALSVTPKYPYVSTSPYHNDSYPSDFLNYLMAQKLNSSATLDPHLPPPSFNTTAPIMEALYTRMFAIVLGSRINDILRPTNRATVVAGFVLLPEARVLVSSPMFILSVTILGVYILFTIMLYIRRPWRILPRMPTTIISQIPFFAASHVLQDLRVMADTCKSEQSASVRGLRQRYGYGRFIGTDGKAHIGIEREPLVQILTKNDLRLMQKDTSSLVRSEMR